MEGDDFGVGCLLSLKTTLGDEFQAQIITYDRPSNLLVLHILLLLLLLLYLTLHFNRLCFQQFICYDFHFSFCYLLIVFFNCCGSISFLFLQEGSKDSPNRNIRLLKASYIKEFTLLGQGDDPLDLKHCQLDLNLLHSREDAALRQAEIDAERIGVGVTNEAQNIFDALSKTLPVRWDKTVIVVMNEVRVSSPYLPENVSGGTSAANERVKKVLEFERKRLHARGASQ